MLLSGIFMENGSGGFFGGEFYSFFHGVVSHYGSVLLDPDMVFNGGKTRERFLLRARLSQMNRQIRNMGRQSTVSAHFKDQRTIG